MAFWGHLWAVDSAWLFSFPSCPAQFFWSLGQLESASLVWLLGRDQNGAEPPSTSLQRPSRQRMREVCRRLGLLGPAGTSCCSWLWAISSGVGGEGVIDLGSLWAECRSLDRCGSGHCPCPAGCGTPPLTEASLIPSSQSPTSLGLAGDPVLVRRAPASQAADWTASFTVRSHLRARRCCGVEGHGKVSAALFLAGVFFQTCLGA